MIELINPLSSQEKAQKQLAKIHSKNKIVTDCSRLFLRTKVVKDAPIMYFNVSTDKPSKEDMLYVQFDKVYATFSTKQKTTRLEDLKHYYESLNNKNKERSVIYLVVIVTIVSLGIFFPVIPTFITGWLSVILVTISAVDILNQRRFLARIYTPFLKKHGYLDKQLQNRYIIKSPNQLDNRILEQLQAFGPTKYLKQVDDHCFYQCLTLKNRNDVLSFFTQEDLLEVEVLSTVKPS